MGANAQTTVPTFTAGQVLTAAQMNQSARTGVPVFAGTTERDAAFGGTGEKTLAEGQLCYLESTNVVQYYDGSNWATVGPQTLASGLNYINGATFTTAASVSLANDTFTATYANYKLIFNITAASTDITLTMRLRASGSDNTTSNYNNGLTGLTNTNVTQTKTASGQNTFTIADISGTGVGYATATFDIFAPQLARKTEFSGFIANQPNNTAGYSHMAGGGIFNATTAFDALSIICSTGTITGNYRVYGYANS